MPITRVARRALRRRRARSDVQLPPDVASVASASAATARNGTSEVGYAGEARTISAENPARAGIPARGRLPRGARRWSLPVPTAAARQDLRVCGGRWSHRAHLAAACERRPREDSEAIAAAAREPAAPVRTDSPPATSSRRPNRNAPVAATRPARGFHRAPSSCRSPCMGSVVEFGPKHLSRVLPRQRRRTVNRRRSPRARPNALSARRPGHFRLLRTRQSDAGAGRGRCCRARLELARRAIERAAAGAEDLAQAVEGCAAFLYFLSPRSVASRYCSTCTTRGVRRPDRAGRTRAVTHARAPAQARGMHACDAACRDEFGASSSRPAQAAGPDPAPIDGVARAVGCLRPLRRGSWRPVVSASSRRSPPLAG